MYLFIPGFDRVYTTKTRCVQFYKYIIRYNVDLFLLSFFTRGVSPMPSSNLDKSDRVLYLQLINDNPSAFDFLAVFKYLSMWMRYQLLTFGSCDGIVVIMDTKALSWRHIIKLPIGITAKMLKYMEVRRIEIRQ